MPSVWKEIWGKNDGPFDDKSTKADSKYLKMKENYYRKNLSFSTNFNWDKSWVRRKRWALTLVSMCEI